MGLSLNVNGVTREIDADPATPLIFVLRNHLGLMGAKLGCGLEQCGACAVLIDDESVLSCNKAAGDFSGRTIVTIEGLAQGGTASAVQQAFIDENAAQCGYCTAGIIVATTALLAKNARPSRTDVAAALDKHLCRCGSHNRVLRAIGRLAAKETTDGR